MTTPTLKLYPSAPLENTNNNLEERLEKRLSDVNSFNNSVNNIKEMITYFKDVNKKSKKKYKRYKILNTILKSVDSIVIIGSTSTSVTLSITGVGLIVVPISAGIACGVSLCNELLYEISVKNYNKYNKEYQKDELTIKSLDKLYRKCLQDNIIDKIEYESLCNIFNRYVNENKNESFL